MVDQFECDRCQQQSARGHTIVHVAAKRCEIKILEYIVENAESWKIDFALKDYSGHTPYECIPRLSAKPNARTRRYFERFIFPLLPTVNTSQRAPLVDIRELFISTADRERELQEQEQRIVEVSQ